jgi:hypothetical protein
MKIVRFAAVFFLVAGCFVQAFSQLNIKSGTLRPSEKNLKKISSYVYLPESKKAAAEAERKFADWEKRSFKCSFLTLNNLAMAAKSISDTDADALDCLHSLLVLNEYNAGFRSDLFRQITAVTSNSSPITLQGGDLDL